MARDPKEIAATLRQLARLDLAGLGQQAVLERIVQAAATCCASTGGVGLLLLNHDQLYTLRPAGDAWDAWARLPGPTASAAAWFGTGGHGHA